MCYKIARIIKGRIYENDRNVICFFSFNSYSLDLNDTEKEVEKVSDKDKIFLCEEFSSEYFCGSKIDEEKCLDNYKFERVTEFVKNKEKLVTKIKTRMKSEKFEFVRKDRYKIIVEKRPYSLYESTSYDAKFHEKDAPDFVVDQSCQGDDDNDD